MGPVHRPEVSRTSWERRATKRWSRRCSSSSAAATSSKRRRSTPRRLRSPSSSSPATAHRIRDRRRGGAAMSMRLGAFTPPVRVACPRPGSGAGGACRRPAVATVVGTNALVTRPPPIRSPRRDADRSPSSVIRAWANTLRRGDVTAAASHFALPAIVQNGTPPLELTSRAQVRDFNAALPCGARVLRTYGSGRYTTAVFRLTERPGAGRCGSGTGLTARTKFLIRDGKIREWRRVADGPAPSTPSAPVV